MTRPAESVVFALGFLIVLVGIAFRIYADVVAGVDHATLANQDVLRELLPADATRVGVIAVDRGVPPLPMVQNFAFHQVFFETDTPSDAFAHNVESVLTSRGWTRVLARGPSRPGDATPETWCRGAVQLSFSRATYIALTSIASEGRDCDAPAVTEQLSDSTIDTIVGVLPFVGYLVIAYRSRARGRAIRAETTSRVTGLAHHAVTFGWVPYAVLLVRPLPELVPLQLVRLVGLVLAVAGIAIAVWALRTLGRHFDLELEVHADHELVRRGPYAFVRHPIYAGLIVHTVGLCLASGNVLLIAGSALVTVPILVLRARAEERLLREQFGAEYDAYAKRVGMLVPLR